MSLIVQAINNVGSSDRDPDRIITEIYRLRDLSGESCLSKGELEYKVGQAYQFFGLLLLSPDIELKDDGHAKILDYFSEDRYDPDFTTSSVIAKTERNK